MKKIVLLINFICLTAMCTLIKSSQSKNITDINIEKLYEDAAKCMNAYKNDTQESASANLEVCLDSYEKIKAAQNLETFKHADTSNNVSPEMKILTLLECKYLTTQMPQEIKRQVKDWIVDTEEDFYFKACIGQITMFTIFLFDFYRSKDHTK